MQYAAQAKELLRKLNQSTALQGINERDRKTKEPQEMHPRETGKTKGQPGRS
jgi:hypothetical protein